MTKAIIATLLVLSAYTTSAQAENYIIDTKGAHAFIQFKIKHLGYSWLYGRFNTFSGQFNYDENKPADSRVNVKIDATSIDSNHAERDKHLKGKDFLHASQFPEASFTSTSFKETGNGNIEISGNFTLHGVTKEITITGKHTGHGKDPWGGYRRGFEGNTTLKLKDYNINYNLGPASEEVEIILSIEGIKQ